MGFGVFLTKTAYNEDNKPLPRFLTFRTTSKNSGTAAVWSVICSGGGAAKKGGTVGNCEPSCTCDEGRPPRRSRSGGDAKLP